MNHLVFFDHSCSLCQRSVRWIIHHDRKALFAFAPLEGQTAATFLIRDLEYLKNENSLVLVENYKIGPPKIWIRGKAVFRILWLMGGIWRLFGWLCFVPLGVDQIYRWVAKHRSSLFFSMDKDLTSEEKNRFLS
jgi:predicted DCC family thiol-disulfide oxidoreductase YuxK